MFKVKVPKLLRSIRYCLFGVNSVFLLTGILLLIVGIIVLFAYNEYEVFLTNRFYSLSEFVIATGVMIIVTAALGFYGAISEQFYVICAYVVMLLVLLVFELSIVIVGYNLKNDAAKEIRSTMVQTLQLYDSRIDIARAWDDMQMGFECCGVAGRHDWTSNRIPVSCCHIDYGTVSPFECTLEKAYTTGCAESLGEWLSYNAHVIAIAALVTTCLQVVFVAAASWMAWRSKFEEVELES